MSLELALETVGPVFRQTESSSRRRRGRRLQQRKWRSDRYAGRESERSDDRKPLTLQPGGAAEHKKHFDKPRECRRQLGVTKNDRHSPDEEAHSCV